MERPGLVGLTKFLTCEVASLAAQPVVPTPPTRRRGHRSVEVELSTTGSPGDIRRTTISENARTLKFVVHEFEDWLSLPGAPSRSCVGPVGQFQTAEGGMSSPYEGFAAVGVRPPGGFGRVGGVPWGRRVMTSISI